MHLSSQTYRYVAFANSLLFACALALMLDQSMAAAFDRFEQQPHWRSDDRAIVVVDKTGDKAWHDATRFAVNAWNKSTSGTGLRLTWTTGTGECTPGGNRIDVCQQPHQMLGDDIHNDREGLTDLRLGSDRSQAHIGGTAVSVCSNCRLDASRRRVVATHELGHALGLNHAPQLDSVMFRSGGSERPSRDDVAALRQLYGHVDAPDRCGFFNLRAGPLCF